MRGNGFLFPTNLSGFYFSAGDRSDWTAPQNDALWRDAVKTLFDPCPAGWRAPRSGVGTFSPWSGFTKENGTPYNLAEIRAGWGWETPNPVYNTAVWYPFTGRRASEDGTMANVADRAFIWSSTPMNGQSYLLYLTPAEVQPSNLGATRRHRGYPVRCVRE